MGQRRVTTVLVVAMLALVAVPGAANPRGTAAGSPSDVDAAPSGANQPTAGVRRLAGEDRVATAVEVSRATFDSAATAVIATAADYPDALSGSVLAAATAGPLLLTDRDRASASLLNELDRLGVSEVIVLGGTVAVSDSVVTQLRSGGYDVTRLLGQDRYETAVLVAMAAGNGANVVLATGENFPDAVSASAYAASRGWPIILVGRDDVAPAVLDHLANQTDRAVPIGGSAAISNEVLDAIRAQGVTVAARLAGQTRWATSYEVTVAHKRMLGTTSAIWIATGDAFPDALSAGAAAAATGSLLQLTPTTTVDVAASNVDVRGFVSRNRECNGSGALAAGTLVGGTVALNGIIRDQMVALLTCAPFPQPEPEPEPQPDCHPAYPDFCIPPPPPNLDCDDFTQDRFRVDHSHGDPHVLDSDGDGVACET